MALWALQVCRPRKREYVIFCSSKNLAIFTHSLSAGSHYSRSVYANSPKSHHLSSIVLYVYDVHAQLWNEYDAAIFTLRPLSSVLY